MHFTAVIFAFAIGTLALPAESTQRCPPGKVWSDCYGCPHECNKPPPQICDKMCRIGCTCIEGYLLTPSGNCVAPDRCPAPNTAPAEE